MYLIIPMLDRDLFAAVNMHLISGYGSTTVETTFLPIERQYQENAVIQNLLTELKCSLIG